ncbi:MAG TPA: YkvA family protein [Deltaproteobacteria bacterium]|jgi:uncharacterized membrane protein YkvA (DUF1232 family)|nr:YkvA family protein [Deltaproteobacteria bacterium]
MMSGFWETVRAAMYISATALAVVLIVFMVLLALPRSNLRRVVLRILSTLSILAAMAMAVYVVSPLDLVPDGIPAAGTMDDLVAFLVGLGSGAIGLIAGSASRKPALPVRRNPTDTEDDFIN